MKIRSAGWSTGTKWGVPAGPPAGEMWSIAFTSSSEEERITLATHAETVMSKLGAQNITCEKGFATTYVELSLSKEQVHVRFENTNWQTLPKRFIELFEQELRLLKN